jgi:hypothetical protein
VGSPNQATVNIWKRDYNDPALPTVVIFSDGSGGEHVYPGGYVNTVVFTVYRSGPTNIPQTVYYAFGGTAFPGVDYTGPLSGAITIPPGTDRLYFEMTPTQDARVEGIETILVTLVPATGYVIGSLSQAQGEIFDDNAGSVPTINSQWLCVTNGRVSFKVNGTAGELFMIYRSANLVDWTLASPSPIPAGGEYSEPPEGVLSTSRFWRAVPQ